MEFSKDRVLELQAQYVKKIEELSPRTYTGRALYIARLHHQIEMAEGKLAILFLSGKNAKMHKFLLLASSGPGNIRDLGFDMSMTGAFRFGRATMGDSECSAVSAERFESHFQIEAHIIQTIKVLTGQDVEIT